MEENNGMITVTPQRTRLFAVKCMNCGKTSTRPVKNGDGLSCPFCQGGPRKILGYAIIKREGIE